MEPDDQASSLPHTNTALSENLLFAEAEEAFTCIDALTDKARRDESLRRWRHITDKYLECPTLLDASIESMVDRLASLARCRMDRGEDVRYQLSSLYALAKVRGRKIVQRFLPHQVEDIMPVWQALQSINDDSTSDPPVWESLYVLWNWMAVLSLVPFDCVVVAEQTLVSGLLSRSKQALVEAGPIREAAAACLASWLARPDLEQTELPAFVEWSILVIEGYQQQRQGVFTLLGVLQVLTTVLKQSPMSRDQLFGHFAPLWDLMLLLADDDSNLLLHKLLVKWWTRMSCLLLPPRVAAWRYQRGRRSLADNLRQEQSHDGETEASMSRAASAELFFVPDQVEDSMGRLIESLGHSSTIVRWSAAKGIGRITERLPSLCAEDVLDAVLVYFADQDKDNHWHGACLALAELARRGLLLPHRLDEVVPKVVLAIQYDVQRGHKTVGAHVRDAACYTYWAFARAYHPSIMQPYMRELSEGVILTSLFDREVNCRRAASAAFQEAVGRQGAANFPHGIAILTVADYFALGNRTNAYKSISCTIAQYEEYKRPILCHLYQRKLFHWDVTIRELTSKTLGILANLDSSFMAAEVLPFLMDKCVDSNHLQVRHGAVLGVAEIIVALSQDGELLSRPIMERLVGLVPDIEKRRLYRGRGGEIMRSAVCRLVECIATAKVPLSVRDQVRLLDSVDASIPHPNESIQQAACAALQQLMGVYFPVGAKGPSQRLQARVVDMFVEQVSQNDNPAATRGYSLALGCLPLKLLAPSGPVLDSVLDCLCLTAKPESLVGGESDAETRRNALLSVSRIVTTVGVNEHRHDFPAVSMDSSRVATVFNAYLASFDDYRTDRRGDVGSWCRIAGMEGITAVAPAVLRATSTQSLDTLVGGLLKQLAEKLDTVRLCAGRCLERLLLSADLPDQSISYRLALVDALGLGSDLRPSFSLNWDDPEFAFHRVVATASIGHGHHLNSVISGLVVSVGGLTETVAKSASSALLAWAWAAGERLVKELMGCLLQLLSDHRINGRVVLPTMKTCNLLLKHRVLNEVLLEHNAAEAGRFQSALAAVEQGCRDIHRLLAVIDTTISLVDVIYDCTEVRNTALAFLCRMLSHSFPRVRSYTAEQLYVVVLDHAEQYDEDSSVMNMILSTPWSAEDCLLHDTVTSIATELGIRAYLNTAPLVA